MSFLFLLMAGCTKQVEDYVKTAISAKNTSVPTPTPTPSNILYTVSISTPIENKLVGWKVRLQGACSGNGVPVTITDANRISQKTTTCSSNTWKVYMDISALSVGAQTLSVSQTDGQGKTSLVVSIPIRKFSSACDVQGDRAKNLASGLAGGAGTVASPYVICTPNQLAAINGASTSYSFSLENDIDFDDGDTNGDNSVDLSDSDYVSGLGWTPLNLQGDSSSVFFGNSFEVRGLKINNTGTETALFSILDQRMVKNLWVLDSSVTGATAGGLVSRCNVVCVLEDIHVTGSITAPAGFGGAGGIIAFGNVVVLRSSFEGTVTSGESAGGILGADNNQVVAIADSYVKATVFGAGASVGGIAGDASATIAVFANSYVTGSVTGQREVGGITGSYGAIVNSFSDATIGQTGVANTFFGGLNGYGGRIYNSFYAGNLNVGIGSVFGVLSGVSWADVNNYYWSGGTCLGTGGCVYGGTPRASLASFQDTAQAPMNAWDWNGTSADGTDDHWATASSGYPQLWWEQSSSFAVPFSSGAGTLASPYLISTATDLNKIGSNTRWMTSHFKLASSIDMTAIGSYNPIGFRAAFAGQFDGGGFAISNLTFSNSAADGVGFIAVKVLNTIKDLTLTNVSMTGRNSTGVAAGRIEATAFANVKVTSGSATGVDSVGGAIGSGGDFAVTKSSSAATVVGTGDGVGGLVGWGDGNSISTSSATGNVSGGTIVGGILGGGGYVNLSSTYATGNVSGTSKVGGLVGWHGWGRVSRSYSTGNVTGTSQVGGLVGYKDGGASDQLINSFSVSAVNGNSATNDVGPIVGVITDTAGSTGDYTAAVGMTCSNAGVGGVNAALVNTQPTAASFYNPANAPLTAWNFATIWLSNLGISAFPSLL